MYVYFNCIFCSNVSLKCCSCVLSCIFDNRMPTCRHHIGILSYSIVIWGVVHATTSHCSNLINRYGTSSLLQLLKKLSVIKLNGPVETVKIAGLEFVS